jgi:hypothetical protein
MQPEPPRRVGAGNGNFVGKSRQGGCCGVQVVGLDALAHHDRAALRLHVLIDVRVQDQPPD